jgi:hypothetical protein
MMARWIRLGACEPHEFEELYSRLAAAQAKSAAPALLWTQAQTQYLFALIAPRRLAPGRVSRWISWALAPAVATYRQFGLAAYLQDEAMWLHGRRIAASSVRLEAQHGWQFDHSWPTEPERRFRQVPSFS